MIVVSILYYLLITILLLIAVALYSIVSWNIFLSDKVAIQFKLPVLMLLILVGGYALIGSAGYLYLNEELMKMWLNIFS